MQGECCRNDNRQNKGVKVVIISAAISGTSSVGAGRQLAHRSEPAQQRSDAVDTTPRVKIKQALCRRLAYDSRSAGDVWVGPVPSRLHSNLCICIFFSAYCYAMDNNPVPGDECAMWVYQMAQQQKTNFTADSPCCGKNMGSLGPLRLGYIYYSPRNKVC